ncbi:MAG: hypothetical protein AAGF92_11850 [Myxococcota bacterium]
MQHARRLNPVFLFSLSLLPALFTGCADLSEVDELDSVATPEELDHLETASLSGMTAVLYRRSSSCVPRSRVGIPAVVGDDIEFPSEDVAALEVPCLESPAPANEVYFVDGSVIVEFHDLDEPVTFPESELEGYEVVLERDCGDPVVSEIEVDRAVSNMRLDMSRVGTHFDRFYINFAGMTVSPESFLKVDLKVVDIACDTTI